MRKNVLAGLIILLFGITLLLITLGYIDKNALFKLFSFWPVILILIGLEIIYRSTKLGFIKFIPPLILILIFSYIIFSNYDFKGFKLGVNLKLKERIAHIEEPLLEDVSSAKITLKHYWGTMTITGKTSSLLDGYFSYFNFRPKTSLGLTLNPEGNYQQFFEIASIYEKKYYRGKYFFHRPTIKKPTQWNIYLNDKIPLDLNISSNGSKLYFDFSEVKVKNLNLNVGIGFINIILGDRIKNTNVNVKTGSSGIKIVVPKDSGVKVKLSSGLSKTNLKSLKYKKVGKNTYISPNYFYSENKITFHIASGANLITFKKQ